MKKLHLLFHGRMPSEKAAALFAAKSAAAFAQVGFDVTLVAPRRLTTSGDVFAYYHLPPTFKVVYLPTLDLFNVPLLARLAFKISFVVFSLSALFYAWRQSRHDIFYSNETLPLYIVSFIRKNTFFEMHDFVDSKLQLFKSMLHRFRWILVHNTWKQQKLFELLPSASTKTICVPNPVDESLLLQTLNKTEARTKCQLPPDKKIIVYTGHLYGWKGTDTLAQAATQLPVNYLVVFVGGTPADIERFKKQFAHVPTIRIVGHKPHEEIKYWQAAADVLVLPNSGKENISKYYTSPMKLFEYMAARRPIVASRLPSITEIVDERCTFLFEADNPHDLTQRIIQAAESDQTVISPMVERALALVKDNTWLHRAQKISDFIK